MREKPDYCAVARQYAEDVASGAVPACKWVKLACERQTKDLARQETAGFPYRFDPASAVRVCWFIENLQHTKGELAGTSIRLEPWQVFLLAVVFGWKTLDGNRRFRRAYVEVPRGNGKSTLLSGIGLYCLCADGEPGAEVYSFATTRDQAGIVFGDAKRMAQGNKALRDAFGLEVLAHSLYVPKTGSAFQAKSAEGSTLDGLNTHLAIVDELHAHKTRVVYDVVETSLGKRRSSLMFCITTAGFDTAGICYEVRSMSTRVLDGTAADETLFAVIYTIDEADDWMTVDSLRKANPNWGVSVRPEMVLSLLQKAKALPSAINNFKTKHMDIWCSASSAWMDMRAWNACADASLSLEDFEGRRCIIGLDLGSKNDMTAKVRLFPIETDGADKYAVFCDFYLPARAIENGTNSQYRGWAEEGLVHETPGAMTDFVAVERDIREDLSRFEVEAVAYDPWQATQLATSLSEDEAPMLEYRNTVQNMSDPMKTLEALVQDGRIGHDGNPVLAWMMSNVVAKLDAKDNIFPRKERYEQKIDGAVALIMALGSVQAEPEGFSDFADMSSEPFIGW